MNPFFLCMWRGRAELIFRFRGYGVQYWKGAALLRARKASAFAFTVGNNPRLQRSRTCEITEGLSWAPHADICVSRIVTTKKLTVASALSKFRLTKQPLGSPRAAFGKRGRVVQCSRLLIGLALCGHEGSNPSASASQQTNTNLSLQRKAKF